MKKFVYCLFWAGLSVCSASGYFLEDLAQAKLNAEAKSAIAYQNRGSDADHWQHIEIKATEREVDISAYSDPYILLLPTKQGAARVAATVYGLTKKERKLIKSSKGTMLPGVELFSLKRGKNTCRKIVVEIPKGSAHVWVGEQDTIRKLWSENLKTDILFNLESWFPELTKQGFSPDDKFNELTLFKGKTFPTQAQPMARLYAGACTGALKAKATAASEKVGNWADVETVRRLYQRSCHLTRLAADVEKIQPTAIRLALEDMHAKSPSHDLASRYEAKAKQLDIRKGEILQGLATDSADVEKQALAFLDDCREIMLANPLLDEMEIMAVRRRVGNLTLRDHSLRFQDPARTALRGSGTSGASLGIPSLSAHTILKSLEKNTTPWNCDIVKLSDLRGNVKATPLYTAADENLLISNARLHWDGERVAFTMGSKSEKMTVFELNITSSETRQLSPIESNDHFVDSCYLPDGNLVVMSTAIMTALPCEGGSHLISNMYLLNPETGAIRQLGLDQENSYHATVTEDGKVMFVRWEYTDTPHYFTRIVMTMNPDGTNQRSFYGSNSVWPTSVFYPKPVPGKPNLFSAVVSGHHGSSHMGKLVLFDVSRGRQEANGAIQFIGDKNTPVEPVVVDRLYDNDYPKYMYPVPLDAEYHLTMMKPGSLDPWGLYLVDRFDNKTLIYQPDEHFIAWPQVLKKQPLPPVIPSRVDEKSKTSTLYIQDIYQGQGLEGIPRGSVKDLAVYAFHYGYWRAATHSYIGIEGPWDARYLLGTVPVNKDGSVIFETPAMLPISMMPLDKDGAALQKMRSWVNPQPGENLSCVGCHESPDHAPENKITMASRMAPHKIQPWFGDARPYSYLMEIQPTLDRNCISCHDGTQTAPDLRNNFSADEMLNSKKYSASYRELQKYVRRQGPEGDYQLPVATEWHASSSQLVKLLKKGHHGVELNETDWRRLTMWIDLNVPFHATFRPPEYGAYGDQKQWRVNSLKKYAGLDWDPENEYAGRLEEFLKQLPLPQARPARPRKLKKPKLKGWPFTSADAKAMQGNATPLTLEFGEPGRQIKSYDNSRPVLVSPAAKERIEFVRIPAGRFVMGDDDNYPNETPRVVEIKKPFWMSVSEITNSQLQAFDPSHDSRFADMPGKDQSQRGVPLYHETQPAVRVSHETAAAFCDWLASQTGKRVSLPTEQQWEWAARAGTASDMWYGNRDRDFRTFANLSDQAHNKGFSAKKGGARYFHFVAGVNDGTPASAPVKSYQPNAWGLHDMSGNVEEWTSTTAEDGSYIVKGGSWFDMPRDATSAVRWGYAPYMRLPDLGFRVIIED